MLRGETVHLKEGKDKTDSDAVCAYLCECPCMLMHGAWMFVCLAIFYFTIAAGKIWPLTGRIAIVLAK